MVRQRFEAEAGVEPGEGVVLSVQRLAATIEGGPVMGFAEGFELEHFRS